MRRMDEGGGERAVCKWRGMKVLRRLGMNRNGVLIILPIECISEMTPAK